MVEKKTQQQLIILCDLNKAKLKELLIVAHISARPLK